MDNLSDFGPAGRTDSQPGIIGVVGGVGPFAGLDLLGKILDQTVAARDQDHLPVVSVSWPGPIPDRTAFLLGETDLNPAYPILGQLRLLAEAGATVAGIPCNTAHAPVIFDVIRAGVAGFARPLRLLHMIAETAAYLTTSYRDVRVVGVLSTTGAWRVRIYPNTLEPFGLRVVTPDEALQATVHAAIYDPAYGIKALGHATDRARDDLMEAIATLRAAGAQVIILGCTELPLAFPERVHDGLPLVDPTLVLARALIAAVAPERLREGTIQGP